MADRHILWANFDRLLGALEAGLGEIADFLGFKASAEQLPVIVGGPLMGRYSKALEFAYSPSLRAQLIAQEMRAKGAEIQDALAMLERSAQESPLLARALARI